MSTLKTCWSVAAALGGTDTFWTFILLVSVPARKKFFGRTMKRVILTISGKRIPYFLRDSADIATLYEVFVEKEYDFHVTSPSRIIDIGGHVGSASLFFATKYPDALITTYEPDPGNFAVLSHNMESFPNVACVNAAVSEKDGTVDFYSSRSSIASSLIERKDSIKIAVRSLSLESVLEVPADIVKFDIEGAEYTMFKSAPRRTEQKSLIGELHYDLMGSDLDGFLQLFPGFQHALKRINETRSIVVLTKV